MGILTTPPLLPKFVVAGIEISELKVPFVLVPDTIVHFWLPGSLAILFELIDNSPHRYIPALSDALKVTIKDSSNFADAFEIVPELITGRILSVVLQHFAKPA